MTTPIELPSYAGQRSAPSSGAVAIDPLHDASVWLGTDRLKYSAPVYPPNEVRPEVETLRNRAKKDRDLADIKDAMPESNSQDEGTRHGRSKRGAPQ
ncbi:MAG: hypothetical protein E3J66_02635 [Dehalococcoidia bacterium]|nr:MAG: hypothetical protein E3J66_02635 [Dehalococcoidia bacterium]